MNWVKYTDELPEETQKLGFCVLCVHDHTYTPCPPWAAESREKAERFCEDFNGDFIIVDIIK